jgi:hypothetical protein
MLNEIIRSATGSTYIGYMAQRVMYSEMPAFADKYRDYALPKKIMLLSDDERFLVFEHVDGKGMVLRAAQSTRENALRYMTTEERVLVQLP